MFHHQVHLAIRLGSIFNLLPVRDGRAISVIDDVWSRLP